VVVTPILLLGAGRMGGALLAGWKRAGAFPADQLMIRDPAPTPEALVSGALIDPDPAAMGRAKTVLLAVKPQIWRGVATEVAPHLAADAIRFGGHRRGLRRPPGRPRDADDRRGDRAGNR
jgi:pyrroline-5-carboxylate reductase